MSLSLFPTHEDERERAHTHADHLEFIGQHFLELFLPQHMETLLKHLPPVRDIATDGLECYVKVQSTVLDVTADLI